MTEFLSNYPMNNPIDFGLLRSHPSVNHGIMDWVIRDNYTTPVINSSRSADEINSFYFYQTEQFTVLWLLFGAIVLGNSAVLVALLFSKSSKSRMNFFIMHLAFADLSVGLISVLTDIIWRITVEWKAGGAACKIVRFMQAVVTYASTYVLVALSLDRLDAITRPMNFSGSWRRARLLVGFAWALSAIFSSPILFLYEERLIEGSFQCWIELGSPLKWQIYMSLVAVTLFVVPALVITACYAVIVYTIWTKSVHITRDSQQSTPLKNGDKHEEADIRRASSRGIIPRAKIKTVKMTFVIVFVFILCWSPYIVFDLLQVYGYVPRTQTNIAVATFIQSLAPLNSAANPVIYCLFSTHICRSLGKLPPFSWICCCLTSGGPESSSSLIDTVTSTLRRATLRTQDNNV